MEEILDRLLPHGHLYNGLTVPIAEVMHHSRENGGRLCGRLECLICITRVEEWKAERLNEMAEERS